MQLCRSWILTSITWSRHKFSCQKLATVTKRQNTIQEESNLCRSIRYWSSKVCHGLSSRPNLQMHFADSSRSSRWDFWQHRNFQMKARVLSTGQQVHRHTSTRRSVAVRGNFTSLESYLQRIMAMIPRSSILHSFEFVSVAMTWSNWTLRNRIHAIIFDTMKLPDPMPMYRCTITVKVICDGNFNIITPTCLNPRTRILFVEDFALIVLASIRIERHI